MFRCPYCGYVGFEEEFYEEYGQEEPTCPDCKEDLTGEFFPEDDNNEEEEEEE